MEISGSTLIDNEASEEAGAVYAFTVTNPLVSDGWFRGHTAPIGGAHMDCCSAGSSTWTNVASVENVASSSRGGAVYGWYDRCVPSGSEGGAIWWGEGLPTITNSVIAWNEGDGALNGNGSSHSKETAIDADGIRSDIGLYGGAEDAGSEDGGAEEEPGGGPCAAAGYHPAGLLGLSGLLLVGLRRRS